MNFGFGTPPKTMASVGFSMPTSTTTTTATQPTGFSLPGTQSFTLGTDPSKQGSFSFGLNKTTNSPSTTGTTTLTTLQPLNVVKTTASLTLGASAAPATGFSLTSTTTTPSTGFNLGTTSTTTGFSLGTGLGGTPSTTTTTVTGVTSVAPASITSTTVVTSSSGSIQSATPSVNFIQLEQNINKWTIELEEQEKVFMNQVAQVNAWDRLLLSNGDKIVSLNSGVEKVKLEQQQLDHELDFILAQQRELEECLIPLEKEFADITVSDPERDTIYQLAENLNTQLKQMSEDLKEVIEHINERNKNQDSSDPIVQIGKILNAHMNSLQWVDQNTMLIQQQLDQVSKLSNMNRHDNETTQNL